MIVYTCHGAALGVTGSCHLVECGESWVLVDCGLFQGSRDAVKANLRDVGFDPRSIDAVLLTHAHLDHCGRLPKLVRDGFTGPSTPMRPNCSPGSVTNRASGCFSSMASPPVAWRRCARRCSAAASRQCVLGTKRPAGSPEAISDGAGRRSRRA
ncbi:MBL fold metallo-hydrolase [Luteibacter sp. CQ10]